MKQLEGRGGGLVVGETAQWLEGHALNPRKTAGVASLSSALLCLGQIPKKNMNLVRDDVTLVSLILQGGFGY